jgi:hypothetical protein
MDIYMFDVAYFIGLSLSVFGLMFEIVDQNKKKWIHKDAWRKTAVKKTKRD